MDAELNKKKKSTAVLSVISNSLLIVLKLIVGLMIGAVSVISEAIHSAVDLVAAIIALFAVRTSTLPPDERHRFGHGKYENLSGALEAFLIFVAAAWIIFEAVRKLIHPEPLETVGLGIIVMVISSVVNILVSQRLFKIGRLTDSLALLADAWHLRTDVYTAVGVAISLIAYWLGSILFPEVNLLWLDPVAAIVVALMILKAAWDLTKQSMGGLLDESLPKEEEKWVIETIHSFYPKVLSYHNFKTRKAGAERFIEFHLVVDQYMTVKDSHQITDDITQRVREKYPFTVVTIHIEPCEHHCKEKCKEKCILETGGCTPGT
jgi:cation diffusion facilitator family transporter